METSFHHRNVTSVESFRLQDLLVPSADGPVESVGIVFIFILNLNCSFAGLNIPKLIKLRSYIISGGKIDYALVGGVAWGLYSAPCCNAPPPTCTYIDKIQFEYVS